MEIAQDFCSDWAWHPDAILALQYAAEDYLVEMFQVRLPVRVHG